MDDALASVASLLERAAISYAAIGGHAVNLWLEPRFTSDIDVTVEAGPDEMTRLLGVLREAGYAVAQEDGADLPSGPDFVRLGSSDGVITLEIQAAKTDFQRSAIRRAVTVPGGLRVATPEDLLVFKLIANRPKDRHDLDGLVRLPDLDWSYVERWAEEWGVSDDLRRLRANTQD